MLSLEIVFKFILYIIFHIAHGNIQMCRYLYDLFNHTRTTCLINTDIVLIIYLYYLQLQYLISYEVQIKVQTSGISEFLLVILPSQGKINIYSILLYTIKHYKQIQSIYGPKIHSSISFEYYNNLKHCKRSITWVLSRSILR